MQIAIVGHGTMGTLLAARLSNVGHEVRSTSSGPGPGLVSLNDATARAEVVFLATPADAALTLPASTLEGKIVVDLTNPLTADSLGLTLGHTDSSAERIARTYPKARVVKAFVVSLVTGVGFEPVDAGPLKNARYLEPLAELMIQLGFALGRGTQLSPHMLSR